jgi:hypothetical protein
MASMVGQSRMLRRSPNGSYLDTLDGHLCASQHLGSALHCISSKASMLASERTVP